MKIISDIRLYKSEIPNIDGNAYPIEFTNKSLAVKIHRIVMKLREKGFSLGEFDHLYINFTTCAVNEGISISGRSIDKYHPWYRYYDIEISQELFEKIDTNASEEMILSLVDTVLKTFATAEFDKDIIHKCVDEALTLKENMLMKFKEKKAAKSIAIVYLRYLDNGMYQPLLKVENSDGQILLEKDLPQMIELNLLGEITLNTKRVTIKPRKNIFTQSKKPITFEICQ